MASVWNCRKCWVSGCHLRFNSRRAPTQSWRTSRRDPRSRAVYSAANSRSRSNIGERSVGWGTPMRLTAGWKCSSGLRWKGSSGGSAARWLTARACWPSLIRWAKWMQALRLGHRTLSSPSHGTGATCGRGRMVQRWWHPPPSLTWNPAARSRKSFRTARAKVSWLSGRWTGARRLPQ